MCMSVIPPQSSLYKPKRVGKMVNSHSPRAHVCCRLDFLGSRLWVGFHGEDSGAYLEIRSSGGKVEQGTGSGEKLGCSVVSAKYSRTPQKLWTNTALKSCCELWSGSQAFMSHLGSSCRGQFPQWVGSWSLCAGGTPAPGAFSPAHPIVWAF